MKLEVKDMSCGGCANAIKQAITAADPAATVAADVESKIVSVGSTLGVERVVEVVEAAGFHPVIVAS